MPFKKTNADSKDARFQAETRKVFIGRTSGRLFFIQHILNPEDPTYHIISISGQGGVGKSTLLNRFIDETHGGDFKDYCLTARVNERQTTPANIMEKFAEQLPVVPSEGNIWRYYEVVWQAQQVQDGLLIKTFLYIGVRVSELVNIRLDDVDVEQCQITIVAGKGNKDRVVPFPPSFKEALAMHMEHMRTKRTNYLFESEWKRKHSDQGVRKLLERYVQAAELEQGISPHTLRHFLFTWLMKQRIDAALIQPY